MHQEGNFFWAVDKDKYVSREIKGCNIFSVLHIKDKLCIFYFLYLLITYIYIVFYNEAHKWLKL